MKGAIKKLLNKPKLATLSANQFRVVATVTSRGDDEGLKLLDWFDNNDKWRRVPLLLWVTDNSAQPARLRARLHNPQERIVVTTNKDYALAFAAMQDFALM